jgi:hypothetical protein
MYQPNPFAELDKQLRETAVTLQANFQKLSLQMSEIFDGIRPLMLAIADSVSKLPDDLRVVVTALAERGWYISSSMGLSLLRQLQTAIESENYIELDKLMESWVAREAPEIEATVVMRFPGRAAIIAKAFDAHRREHFELSIPVLLIQVEGMCVQELGVKFYSTNKGIPNTKGLAESMTDNAITEVFLLPLCQPSGLTASAAFRSNYPHAVNRHEVLHGTNTEYASLTNSLKTISLLSYFVSFAAKEKI